MGTSSFTYAWQSCQLMSLSYVNFASMTNSWLGTARINLALRSLCCLVVLGTKLTNNSTSLPHFALTEGTELLFEFLAVVGL